MGNNQLPFNEKDIRRVLGSPEGQKILKLLNQDGGQALRQAANALRNGNTEEAKRIISPIMESEEGILSMAKSLGLGQPPEDTAEVSEENTASAEPAGSFSSGDLPFSVGDLLSAASQMNGKEVALLNALKPFLHPTRQGKIDRAVKAARISRMAGSAIRRLEENQQGR